jgi:prevent-host-death family protein
MLVFTAATARASLADIIREVQESGKMAVITRYGRPIGAIVPYRGSEEAKTRPPPAKTGVRRSHTR